MEGNLRRSVGVRWCAAALCAALAVILEAVPAHGQQHRILGRPRGDVCPPPPCCPPAAPPATADPATKPDPTKPAPKTDPTKPAPAEPAPAAPLTFEGGPAVRGATIAYATPNLQGDQLGIPAIAFGPRGSTSFPPAPGQVAGAALVPSVRSFKVCENDSPFPRDRAYFGFHYYDVNKAVNRRIGSDLENLRAHRATFGLEKTFLDGDVSVGLRLPLDTLRADSRVPGFGGDSTAVGDLSVILKAALWGDLQAGRILTAGLAVTTPTGPGRFAGFEGISGPPHTTILQPFVGGVWGMGDFFIHGYSALDVPMNSGDVTLMYNDFGVGYFLHRDTTGAGRITAVIPTFEVHINTPLNHRGLFRGSDPAGTPDVIALTTGITFEINRRATLAFGVVTPVTGPRPFDWEMLAQLNVRLGGAWGRPGMLGN